MVTGAALGYGEPQSSRPRTLHNRTPAGTVADMPTPDPSPLKPEPSGATTRPHRPALRPVWPVLLGLLLVLATALWLLPGSRSPATLLLLGVAALAGACATAAWALPRLRTPPGPAPLPGNGQAAPVHTDWRPPPAVAPWFVDAASRGLRLSPAASRLLGLPASHQLTLTEMLSLFDAGERQSLQTALDQTLNAGCPFELRLSLPLGNGRRQALLVAADARRDEHRLLGADAVFVTLVQAPDQLPASDALRVCESVINASTDMVSVLDSEHRYRLVNDTWCRISGHSREQALGQRSSDMLPGLISPARLQALDACLQHGRASTVRDTMAFDGRPARHVHSTFHPVSAPDGGPRLAALITRDVTHDERQHAALEASAESLRATLDATGDAIFAADAPEPDEPARFVNRQWLTLWGLPDTGVPPSPQELISRASTMVQDPQAELERIRHIVATGKPHQDEVLLLDGRVLLRRFASVIVNGRQLRVWSLRDVTTERRAHAAAEAAAAEQREQLENYPGYITVVDADERYRHVNERLAQALGRPREQIIGHTVREVLGEVRWQELRPVVEEALRKGRAVAESRVPTPDGQGWVDLQVTHIAGPLRPDGSRSLYAFGLDITERKRAQAALAAALAEAEQANHAKSRFLSSLSHELRTPLNAVLGFGQLLARQPLGTVQDRQVQEILRGGRHLLSLINDLLDLRRIDAGELEIRLEAVDTLLVLHEAVALLGPLAMEHQVHVFVHPILQPADEPPAGAWADPRRLRQVLINLLANAIRFSPPGGQVDVLLRLDSDPLVLRIRDGSPGLDAGQRKQLLHAFDPFDAHTADSHSLDGVGIGLSLSRDLMEAMGGQVGIDSGIDGGGGPGNTFWLQIKRVPMPAPATMPPETSSATGTGPHRTRQRLLYIEDNPINQVLMTAMLEGEFDIVTEADPLTGLDRVHELKPDLLLLDIHLPGISGIEVLRRLRADPRTAGLPAVAVSANALPEDIEAGMAAGFDAYLTKPVDFELLQDTVRRLLHQPA